MAEEDKLNRGFGLWSSLSLVIGTIIGSGIFFKQGSVLQTAGDTNTALWAWLAGGILTLTAGMTVAEVGSQMAETGGIYSYLTHLYGKTVGYLAGWMQVIFYGPAMMGAISAYFGVLFVALFGLGSSWSLPAGMAALAFVGLVNSIPNHFSAGFQVITTTIKMLPIVALIIFGLFFGKHDALGQTVTVMSHGSMGGFGVAVLATLFAYDGWVTLANISGEIKNPQKVLPKAIITGILIVIVAYMGISYGAYRSLTANEIVNLGENTTLKMATNAFGYWGGRVLSVAILISLIGTLNGKVVSFPRILYVMAKKGDFIFAKSFAKIHHRAKTPNNAIWFMVVIAYVMMLLTDPDQLSDYAIFVTFLFYILVFIGAFILRRRDPKGEKRTFSMPLYPVIPVIAILGSLYVEISELLNDLHGVLISVIIILLGLPIFWWLNRKK
ncbi:amino acid transporter [Fructobacillus pseudoficulneus]|uniref:Amino acid transporter n=1 Tax=Fructobacillus pseudoficulneus TaxID=220714 RepID=A0A3F3H4R9_9LACO|nr:APC family permease [Fructobacillus pseudoficulneus]GAP02980.1 amino acid transporter [Fructobacillus pseudoficulneus]SEH44713.1 serine/threonine exchange transporter, LAT family [Fructobacillus pseudoficulneus]